MRRKTRSQLFVLAILLGIIAFGSWNANQNVCANSISCLKDLSGAVQPGEKRGTFLSREVRVPDVLTKEDRVSRVLGESNVYKRIQIDLTNQRLHAYEGDRHVFEFPISSGKWAPTPTGTFRIWVKLRRTKMEGGNKAIGTYYYLPNVPHVMYFYNEQIPKTRGFGLHGAYWHNNFGHPMSHGCVNLPLEAAEQLFNWADPPTVGNTTYPTAENPGTRIIIYGEAPKE